MAVKYWRASAGTSGSPSNWSSNLSWQYWDGSAWTASPSGSTPGTNYPGTNGADGDHVLIHSTFRISLDIDVNIKSLTNILTGFPGTSTTAASGSGVVYSTNRTITCDATTSVAGTANTNISATTVSLIYPIAAGATLTIGNSTNLAYIRGLLAGATGGLATISSRDAANALNWSTTLNIVGNIYGGTTYQAINAYISPITLNLDGMIYAQGYAAIGVDNSTLTIVQNGSIFATGTVSAITSGTANAFNLNLSTKPGGSLNLYAGSTGNVVNTGLANSGNVVVSLTGGEIVAGTGTGNIFSYNSSTVSTVSMTFNGTAITASDTAPTIYLANVIPTTFSLLGNCVVTNTTNRNAISTQRLNAESTVKFKIKTGGGIENTFQVATGAIPAASDVRFGTSVGSTTGTLVVPPASTVLLGTPVDATTGTLDIPNAVAQVVGNIVANLT